MRRLLSDGQFFALDSLYGRVSTRPVNLVARPRQFVGQPESIGTARGLLVGLCDKGYAQRVPVSRPARYEITPAGRELIKRGRANG